jgi:hypothetical protein
LKKLRMLSLTPIDNNEGIHSEKRAGFFGIRADYSYGRSSLNNNGLVCEAGDSGEFDVNAESG